MVLKSLHISQYFKFCNDACSADAFLHQIHTGTANLKFLINRVREIIEQKVEGTIDRIKNMMLFDYELAFSKSWVSPEK